MRKFHHKGRHESKPVIVPDARDHKEQHGLLRRQNEMTPHLLQMIQSIIRDDMDSNRRTVQKKWADTM
jgi:hypothetical protein